MHHLYLVSPPSQFDDGKCAAHFATCLRKVWFLRSECQHSLPLACLVLAEGPPVRLLASDHLHTRNHLLRLTRLIISYSHPENQNNGGPRRGFLTPSDMFTLKTEPSCWERLLSAAYPHRWAVTRPHANMLAFSMGSGWAVHVTRPLVHCPCPSTAHACLPPGQNVTHGGLHSTTVMKSWCKYGDINQLCHSVSVTWTSIKDVVRQCFAFKRKKSRNCTQEALKWRRYFCVRRWGWTVFYAQWGKKIKLWHYNDLAPCDSIVYGFLCWSYESSVTK